MTKVTRLSSADSIREFLDAETLIIIDLDARLKTEVIAEKLGHQPSLEEEDIVNSILALNNRIDHKLINLLLTEEISTILKETNAKIVGISSCLTAKMQIGDEAVDCVTSKTASLAQLGYDFDKDKLYSEHSVTDTSCYLGSYPKFTNGIMFTNGLYDAYGNQLAIGTAVMNILTYIQQQFIPKRIVILSSYQNSVDAIVKTISMNDSLDCELILQATSAHLDSWLPELLSDAPEFLNLTASNVNRYFQQLNTQPLEQHTALSGPGNFKIAPDLTKIHFLTTGLFGGVVQCKIYGGELSAAKSHRSVSELWIFRGKLDLAVWRYNGMQSDLRIIAESDEYSVLNIPPRTSFQFRNFGEQDSNFLIATVPTWPGSQEATSVAGIFDDVYAEQKHAANTSASGPKPLFFAMAKRIPSQLAAPGVSIKGYPGVNGSYLAQVTLQPGVKTLPLRYTKLELIICGQNLQGLQVVRKSASKEVLYKFAATDCPDAYSSLNVPRDVVFSCENTRDEPLVYLQLMMSPRPKIA